MKKRQWIGRIRKGRDLLRWDNKVHDVEIWERFNDEDGCWNGSEVEFRDGKVVRIEGKQDVFEIGDVLPAHSSARFDLFFGAGIVDIECDNGEDVYEALDPDEEDEEDEEEEEGE